MWLLAEKSNLKKFSAKKKKGRNANVRLGSALPKHTLIPKRSIQNEI